MLRVENALDLLQIPAARLNEREIHHNRTEGIKEDIEDVEAPRDVSDCNRWHVGVDHEDDVSCQVVECESFSAGVEGEDFGWVESLVRDL